MCKIVVSAALFLGVTAASALAAPMPDASGIGQAGPLELATHYYGHKPKCFFKKIKKYDYYGKLVIKKVKVCH